MKRRLIHLAGTAVWFGLSIASCAQTVTSSQDVEKQLRQFNEEAKEAQQRSDYPEAIRKYKNILRIRPEFNEVRTKVGLLEHLTGDHEAALADFRLVLKSSPKEYVPNLLAGFDLLQLGQPQSALPYLLQARRLDPKDAQAALGLGQAYAALRKFDQANAAYYQAALSAPLNSEAYYGLGVTYLSLSRNAAVRIRELDARGPLAQSLLAEALMDQGKVEHAVAVYESLVNSGSLPAPVCWLLGAAYVRQGKLPEAAKEFDRILRWNPGCLGVHLGRASLCLRQDNISGALDQLETISKVDPGFLRANLASMWQLFTHDELSSVLGKLSEPSPTGDAGVGSLATSSLRRWLDADASSYLTDLSLSRTTLPSAPAGRARVSGPTARQLLAQGHFSECELFLRTKKTQTTEDELTHAECAFNIGDYRTAFVSSSVFLRKRLAPLVALYWQTRSASRLGIGALVQAVRTDPDSTRAHLLLAETLRERQDYSKAEAEYSKALAVDPEFTPARLGLATLYWDISQFDQALAALEIVLQNTPRDPDANYMVASIFVQRRRFDEALPHLREALNGRPEIISKSHALLGRVYAAQGLTNVAITELQQVLAEDSDGSYHYQIAQLYRKLGNEGAATTAMRESEAIRQKKRD